MSKIEYLSILSKAKECQNNVKTKKKNGISTKWSYYISKSILKPKTDITKITINDAVKPTQSQINQDISKTDYLDACERYTKYIEKHNKLPNYVTVKGYKIKPYLFTEITSRILIFYNKNNRLPSTAKFNSDIYKKDQSSGLHDYITSKGCSGMGQCTSYYCACNSLQQCFYRLTGIKVDESTIAAIAGTTTAGTDHNGINTAVAWFNKKYNKNIKITWKNFSDLGKTDSERWKTMQQYINKGAVFCHIKYRGVWGHYEVPKAIDNSLTILNSLGDKCTSVSYCGYIENRTKADQLSYIKGISQKSIAILEA